jgi:putative transposase
MLTHDLPSWQTVYHYFRLWRRDGTRARINDALRTGLWVASEREPEPSAAIVDSQSVKTTKKEDLVGMMRARKLKGANGICWLTPRAYSSP